MAGSVIGLLHPGEMGAAVAGCLTAGGHQVLWLPSGRSPGTAARATAAGVPGGFHDAAAELFRHPGRFAQQPARRSDR